MHDLFFEIGTILILTALFGLLCRALGQSLILAYLGAGILMGPLGQKWLEYLNRLWAIRIPALGPINNIELINTLSVFGVILLLFMIGLEMNIKDLRGLKSSILIICLGQIIATFAITWLLLIQVLKDESAALLSALAITFSSTIIGVKILSDKKDINSLYGKIVIGVLLAQDLLAIFTIVVLSSLQQGGVMETGGIVMIIAKFIGLFAFTFIWGSTVLPWLFNTIAASAELIFLAAIANCFLLAGIAELLDISVEIGAFLGGLSLASLPHHLQLISKIRPLRDFFLILFFVSLGLHFDLPAIGNQLPLLAILLLLTLVLKPLIAIVVVSAAGFKKRTAFMSGISLAQLSEFSLIILGIALSQSLINNSLLSTFTLTLMISILVSTYLSRQAPKIFLAISKYLHFLELKNPREKMHSFRQKPHGHIILCGYAAMGENILRSIQKAHRKHVVVDLNPEHIQKLIKKRTPYIFGDMTDPEVLELLNIQKASVLISTISRYEDNAFILDYVRRHNKNIIVMVEAGNATDALDLYSRGADYVIMIEHIGGDHTSLLLEDLYGANGERFFKHKNRHIEFLKNRGKLA